MTGTQRDRVGYVLADKYEIVSRIGSGGFSTVWMATDRRLSGDENRAGKLWAVKEFRHSGTDRNGDTYKQSLVAEANLMKRLDHPNIVRVADIIDTGETIFVVMDFVEGKTLSQLLKDAGRALPQEDVIGWGIQICDALGYLHSLQPPIVYRDMKPSNVMLREEGAIRLIDFGIAREYKQGKSHDTQVIATEGYAAPEQLNPDVQTDPRADIYSLGITLYHLVTGHDPTKPPFEIRPIRAWDPQLSEGLEAIVIRATQPDPEKRYQTIGEMRYDLEHYKELTTEYRAVLQHKVDVFRRWAIAAGASLAVGVGCLVGSAAMRSSTYESYVHAAQNSSTEEQVDAEGNAVASAAEQNYLRAIELEPGRIENYQALVDLYKRDLLFTAAESARWQSLWVKYSPNIAGDPAYARLNYDAGMLYLCYYDSGDTGDVEASRTIGQAGLANTSLAAAWFERAHDAVGGDGASAQAAREAMGEANLESLESLLVVSRFKSNVGQAQAEGREREVYGELWQALIETFDASAAGQETMVRLRVNQVVFETLRSETYLRGLRRSGVSKGDAQALLEDVVASTEALSMEAQANEQSLLPIYEEITGGRRGAEQNINTVYENVVAQRGGDLEPLDGVEESQEPFDATDAQDSGEQGVNG